MSMRTAIMEMYGAKKVKREAWVPEGIADEDVSDFMGAAAAAKKSGKKEFEFGGKKYKVTMKDKTADEIEERVKEALDADDVDTVKAVIKGLKGASKSHAGQAKQLKKDLEDSAHTEMDPKKHVKYNDEMKMYCVYNKDGKVVAKFKDEKEANAYAMKNHDELMGKEEMDEVSYKTAMKSYQKAMGQSKDADDAGDKKTGDKKFDQAVKFGRYANKKFQSSKNKKKLVRTFTGKESVEEAAAPGSTAQHGPDTATSDSYDKQLTTRGGEKEFTDKHTTEVAYDAEELYKKNQEEAEAALKKTPGRLGDQKKGDTSFVNPLKAEIIDGITAALAKMKTNS